MRDITEQIQRYADALESATPDASATPGGRRRRPVAMLAACVALVVVAVGLALAARDARPAPDDAVLPTPFSGIGSAPPGWLADARWLASASQVGLPDGPTTRYDIGDPERPVLVIERGRIVLRTPCAAVAAPVAFGTVPATDLDSAKTSVRRTGPWVHAGCDLPEELTGLLQSDRLVAEGGPGYPGLELTTDRDLQIHLVSELHQDPDAQYLLEPLLEMTMNLDVVRSFAHLADALPNDIWQVGGEQVEGAPLVVIGRVVGHEVVDRNGAIPSVEDPRSLHLRVRVEQSWGERVEPEITVALLTRGQDPDRMAAGFVALGRIVLLLDPDSPVYEYTPEAYAIGDNGALIISIEDNGRLAIPAYPGYLADPFLEGVATLDQLIDALEEPTTDHGELDAAADG